MSGHHAITVSEEVLEQAFHWAMLLGDSHVSVEVKQAFELWLQQQQAHKIAWQRIQVIEQEFTPVKSVAKQSIAALSQLASKRRAKRNNTVSSVFSVMLLVGLSLFYSTEKYRYDYVTGRGEQQQFTLTGGAKVHLDVNSQLDVEYTEQGILLHLTRGQLLVDSSAANANNKPQVTTEYGRFKPIGTRFVVRELTDNTELAVTAGQVKISIENSTKRAIAGERWRVTLNSISKQGNNGLTADAWLDNVVEANNARLGDVLSILSQHHSGWLNYSDAVADLRVTGVFRLDNTTMALNSLQNSLPIRIEKTTDWWVKLSLKE